MNMNSLKDLVGNINTKTTIKDGVVSINGHKVYNKNTDKVNYSGMIASLTEILSGITPGITVDEKMIINGFNAMKKFGNNEEEKNNIISTYYTGYDNIEAEAAYDLGSKYLESFDIEKYKKLLENGEQESYDNDFEEDTDDDIIIEI